MSTWDCPDCGKEMQKALIDFQCPPNVGGFLIKDVPIFKCECGQTVMTSRGEAHINQGIIGGYRAEVEKLRGERDYFKGEFHFYHKECSKQDDRIERLEVVAEAARGLLFDVDAFRLGELDANLIRTVALSDALAALDRPTGQEEGEG